MVVKRRSLTRYHHAMETGFLEDYKQQVQAYVTRLFEDFQTPQLAYHNLAHTEAVVAHTLEIAKDYLVSERERFILFAAAWFHDTGHLFAPPEGHEAVSVCVMNGFFMFRKSVSNEALMAMAQCIMATRMPTNPDSLLEEIICDADTYHLGTSEFSKMNELVHQEALFRTPNNADDWQSSSIRLLRSHRFYTEYCRKKLSEGKAQNLQLLLGNSS